MLEADALKKTVGDQSRTETQRLDTLDASVGTHCASADALLRDVDAFPQDVPVGQCVAQLQGALHKFYELKKGSAQVRATNVSAQTLKFVPGRQQLQPNTLGVLQGSQVRPGQ